VIGAVIIGDRDGINFHVGEESRIKDNMDRALLRRLIGSSRAMGEPAVVWPLPILVMIMEVLVVVTATVLMDIPPTMAVAIATAAMMVMDMRLLLLLLLRVEITAMSPLSFLRKVKCPMDCIRLLLIPVHVEVVFPVWMGLIHLPLIPRSVLVVLNPYPVVLLEH
jgi:hypothetical protein